MPEQIIAPIIPNISGQEAAVAGSSAIIFTATDRKIIEERGGRIDRNLSFIDLLKDKPLTPEVENEETNVKPQQDIKELEGRYRKHRQMLKHSALYTPREQVKISNRLPDSYEEPKQIVMKSEDTTINSLLEETAAIAKELKLNPAEIFDKFALEQKELHSLICRIKELHLKRLLTDIQKEFESLTKEIEKETLSSAKPEAKPWLEAQLNKLTLDAAEYKLDLLKSLQSMDFNAQRKKNIKWLQEITARLSKS